MSGSSLLRAKPIEAIGTSTGSRTAKKRLLSATATIVLASGLAFAGAMPANAAPAKDVGPFSAAGACNAERSNYKHAYPDKVITGCVNSLGTGKWWFTIYL